MPAKTNGATAEKPLTQDQLLKAEKTARAAWYASFKDGRPVKPYSKDQSAALRTLEKAKSALVASVAGAANFKEAAAKLDYKPQYAPRTRTAAAAK